MPIPTTTIGAYPKPDYVTVPDWFNMGGPDTDDPTRGWAEAMQALGDEAESVLARGTGEAIRDQVDCGVDIPTDGEIRRENYIHYHCRHLSGFDFERLSEKQVRGVYTARLPTITGEIRARRGFLVRDWRVAQSFTDRPVKMTMPGPLTISDTTANRHYPDSKTLGAALADALNQEVMALAEAGCRHIQIDEPVFARRPGDALDFGMENLERAFHHCPAEVTRTVHMCCGYPDRLDNPNYPKAPRESYFDLARLIDASSIVAVSLEDAHRHNDLSLLELFERTTVIFGVVAIAKSRVESVEELIERLQSALDHIDAERLMAAPDCGLALLGRERAMNKLRHMSAAARAVG